MSLLLRRGNGGLFGVRAPGIGGVVEMTEASQLIWRVAEAAIHGCLGTASSFAFLCLFILAA